MRPNFKEIDITKTFAGKGQKPAVGEEWMTAELIPVKPIYTKEDLEEWNISTSCQVFLRSCVNVLIVQCIHCVRGQSVSMRVSLRLPSQTHSIAATLHPVAERSVSCI